MLMRLHDYVNEPHINYANVVYINYANEAHINYTNTHISYANEAHINYANELTLLWDGLKVALLVACLLYKSEHGVDGVLG